MKLLAESLLEFRHLEEGTGDKYAAKKFGIPDEEEIFSKEYKKSKTTSAGEVIGEVNNQPVIKNPDSLQHFPNNARGVIDDDGNLYVSADVEHVIHVDILKLLIEKKAIQSKKPTGWEDPETLNEYKFVTVQRLWNKDIFALGESYVLPKSKNGEEREKILEKFKPYFLKAKEKNRKYKFILEDIKRAARSGKYLSVGEYKEFKKALLGKLKSR